MEQSFPHSRDTEAVHAGRHDLRDLGVHAAPLDMSTTYPVGDLDGAGPQLDAFAAGELPAGTPIYSRLHNPTVGRFETAMAQLESGDEGVAFASGMAALTAVFLALEPDKKHVVGVRPLYGGTDHLLSSGLLGCTVTWVEPEEVAGAIQPDTGLIVLETPQNPTATLVDIHAVAQQAGGIPVLVDNTFATPVLQRPLLLGATLVVHSATKFIGGHGDAMGGVVVTNSSWAPRLRGIRIATGAVLHPFAAYQLHRGLSTLPIRVRHMQATASELAHRIGEHLAVSAVHHPSLAESQNLVGEGLQMSGPGSMLSFELHGGYDAARTVLGHVQLMSHAVSLGSTDTLVQHPASLTHRVVDPSGLESGGINQSLIRISVGLENIDDLWADISSALDAALLQPQEAPAHPAATEGDHATRATA